MATQKVAGEPRFFPQVITEAEYEKIRVIARYIHTTRRHVIKCYRDKRRRMMREAKARNWHPLLAAMDVEKYLRVELDVSYQLSTFKPANKQ